MNLNDIRGKLSESAMSDKDVARQEEQQKKAKEAKAKKAKAAKKKVKEATGDSSFDNMMGKISSNTEPQNFDQARADKVQAGAENPDKETIDALNKMMYDMHVTMQTANKLMQKLTQGR